MTTDAVTPPNPAGAGGGDPQPESKPDPTLLTIDALRREIAMLENLMVTRLEAAEDLTQERFHRLDGLIAHFEEQRREQKADTKAAVDAALASQKEATSKMETTTTSQIDSLRSNFETSFRSIESSIADLKDRMTITESIKQGAVEQRSETRQVSSVTIGFIGLAITVILATLTIIAFAA